MQKTGRFNLPDNQTATANDHNHHVLARLGPHNPHVNHRET